MLTRKREVSSGATLGQSRYQELLNTSFLWGMRRAVQIPLARRQHQGRAYFLAGTTTTGHSARCSTLLLMEPSGAW